MKRNGGEERGGCKVVEKTKRKERGGERKEGECQAGRERGREVRGRKEGGGVPGRKKEREGEGRGGWNEEEWEKTDKRVGEKTQKRCGALYSKIKAIPK